MKNQKILSVTTVIAFQLTAAVPAFAQENKLKQPIQDEKILTGLVKVTREPRKHWYTPHFRGEPTFKIQNAGGGFVSYSEDQFKTLKKAFKKANHESFPDLRSYETAHPRWHKTQMGFQHWNPVLQGSSSFVIPAGVLVGGYWAGRTKQTVTVQQ